MGATCCCLGREREPRAAPQCLLGHPGPAQPAPQPKEPAKEEKEKQTLHHEEDKTKEKEKLVLDDEDFEGFTTKVKSHTHGSKNDNDHLAEVRGSWCFGEPVSQQLVHILCQKGLKGASSPNQDSFSVTHFASGWTLMCILDGHGQHGHQIASRIAWTIPSFLVRDFLSLGEEEAQDSQVENALIMAFENAHFDVLAYAAEQKLNVKLSGTTAVVALVKAGTVYLAHAGDSRAVVGAVQGKHLIASTKDHSPADEGEKERVESCGGHVQTAVCPDGTEDVPRVYIRGKKIPGLAMTRAIGDKTALRCGVIPTPDVVKTVVPLEREPFVIVATDGVWQFLDSEGTAKAVANRLSMGRSVQDATRHIIDLSNEKWGEATAGQYRDDVTCAVMRLSAA